MNTTRLTITIVDPVGVAFKKDTIIPIIKDNTDNNTLDITTVLNFLNNCIDDNVGNIIKLDIKSEPINLIPSTIVIEQRLAKIMLYKLVFIPIDLENLSSKVIANILLYENKYKKITITDRIIHNIISV